MRFSRLGDYASVDNHVFSDGFAFHFRDLHLRNRASLFLLFSKSKLLSEPRKAGYDHHERDYADDDSSPLHLVCNALLIGTYRPEAISRAMCASSNCSWSLIS